MPEQSDRLSRLGWNDSLESAYLDHDPSRTSVPALVVRVDVAMISVLTPGGARRVALAPQVTGAPMDGGISTGDWVLVADDRVHHLLPRRSVLMRRASGLTTAAQAVAANVDLVLITAPLGTPLRLRRIERGLAIAWSSGAVPVVLLTKADLSDDPAADVAAVRAVAGSAEVLAVGGAAAGHRRLETLLAPGAVAVLIGPSGSGKSTLVNRLAGGEEMRTTAVRADGKGRHTTTHRELIELPGGALIIDTPGTRELGLWDAAAGIDELFADLDTLALSCRFSDCRHVLEPGCAVQAAARNDPTLLTRLESQRRLTAEQGRLDDARDLRAAAQGRREFRRRSRAAHLDD